MFQRKKYRLLSDNDLIIAYLENPNNVIMQVIYERYGHLVLGLCIKHMKQIEDAEDICALIFEKLPTLMAKQDIRFFKSWLYQVSKNECLMILRKKKPHTISVSDFNLEESLDDQEEKQIKENELKKMESALGQLKKEQKTCITLFYLEGKSYQEISGILSLSEKAIKSHIQNGKRNLKIVMEAKP